MRYVAKWTNKVAVIKDTQPSNKFHDEVCTIFVSTSAMDPELLTTILNKWDKLQNLPAKASKKQILEIINKK